MSHARYFDDNCIITDISVLGMQSPGSLAPLVAPDNCITEQML